MIVLDIDMPKSCSECELLSEEVWCAITGTSVWQNGIDYNKERLPNCPIIDRLDLMCYQAKFLCECINDCKKTAPQ